MPTNREIENFVELSVVIARIHDDTAAASRFMERNGIGGGGVGRTTRATNGNGHAKRLSPALVERVKRTYTKRRQAPLPPLPVPLRQTSDIEIAPKRKLTYAENKMRGRRQSAAILEALDRVEPRQPAFEHRRGIGALVRRGYAKRKGDGYVRTAKPFTVGIEPATGDKLPSAPLAGAPQSDALTVAEAAKMMKMTDSGVRLIIKAGRLAARQELRPRRGMHKLAQTMVLDRDDVAHYMANNP